MRIILFGAAGAVGSRMVSEAVDRGHDVTAVVRDSSQFGKLPNDVTACSGDAGNAGVVAELAAGHDLLISAIRPPDGKEALLVPITNAILDGSAVVGIRALIVGGAASLMMPGQDKTTVLTAPDFLPEEVMAIARACFVQHDLCRTKTSTDWSYISPPAMLEPGLRTGNFRLGTNELLVDKNGVSAISMEDFAVAMLNEAEHANHHRTRFTAAY
jgi:putative NADH-flavin reductase